MALANSSIQEVNNNMDHKSNGDIKSLAIGSHLENSNPNFAFRNTTDYELDHHQNQHPMSQSLINFKCGIMDSIFHKNNESLLSFEPQGVCDQDAYNWDQQRLMDDDPSCFQAATNNYNLAKDHNKNGDGSMYDQWIYCDEADVSNATQEIGTQKRHLVLGESSGGVCKKQCVGAPKKQKHKSSTAKDPQSIAAKNRRERISERLKMLQELVPNGSKVDLVTMLEKAISYVKFLQVQVKILATDEFWPVQGGKAPDISQVKEAIEAILSSQRERSSSSNSEK